MISFFPENNGLLLQLNTFATQHFCKPTFLQYKAFATRPFCNSCFCNSTLLKFVPLVPFSSIAFRSGVFVHMFFFPTLCSEIGFPFDVFFQKYLWATIPLFISDGGDCFVFCCHCLAFMPPKPPEESQALT